MRNIEIIGMPMKYGCYVEGADLSYFALKDSLENVFNVTSKCIDVSYENPLVHKNDKKLKYVEPVMELSKRLYNSVYNSLNDNKMPVVVGGDHSTIIGSLSGVLDYYNGDVSVIYIDKHADIHTEKTSPSGNLHGIPLSVCMGRCDERFNIGNFKLSTNNLYFVGLSNYEMEEISYIQEKNIYCRMDFEVEEKKVENIVKEIINSIKTKYVHISFDLDVLKTSEFSAVNVGVEKLYQDENGLTLNMVKKILRLLLKNLNVCSMDIVEYNPLLDNDGKCKEKVVEILEEIKGGIDYNDYSK